MRSRNRNVASSPSCLLSVGCHGPCLRRGLALVLVALLGLGPASNARVFGQESEPGRATRAAELERTVRAAIKGMGEVAVAYENLADGEQVFIDADVRYHPASTMKVPVMMEVFRQAAEGTLPLDGNIKLTNDFKSIADDSRFTLDVAEDSETTLYQHLGDERTVRELMRLMITESSNFATNLLVDRVTAARVSELMRSMGAGDVRVLRGVEDSHAFARGLNNETTARGLSRILRQLAARRVVSPKASDEMLAILRGQKFNEGIPAGLPAGTSVAHKTGSITAIYHDAGIVEPVGRSPYVLVVLTRGIQDIKQSQAIVAKVSRAVYEHTIAK